MAKVPVGILIGLSTTLVVLVFSWLIATVPDEGIDRRLGFVGQTAVAGPESLLNPLVDKALVRAAEACGRRSDPPLPDRNSERLAQMAKQPLTEDEGAVSDDNGKGWRLTETPLMRAPCLLLLQAVPLGDMGWLHDWLMPYRVLVVEDADIALDQGDEHDQVGVVLRDRDLRFARLSRSALQRADFTDADLRGAIMSGAQLQGADLRYANLQSARLDWAQLQDADLSGAQLQGTKFFRSKLQGADLSVAELQGATLFEVEAWGANFSGALLHGAELSNSNLLGADLSHAEFHCADLNGSRLQGATLAHAELPGANLSYTKLNGVDFEYTYVWLATFPEDFAAQRPVPRGLSDMRMKRVYEANAKQTVPLHLHDEKSLDDCLNRIQRDHRPTWHDEEKLAKYVTEVANLSSDPLQLVPFLATMACKDTTGYIAASFAKRIGEYERLDSLFGDFLLATGQDLYGGYTSALAEALLEKSCEGAKALSDEGRARLGALVSSAKRLRWGPFP